MKLLVIVLLTGSLASLSVVRADPALRVVRDEPGASRLQNGDFEQTQSNKPVAWQPAPKGSAIGEHEGRNDSTALVCENPSGEGWFGASQTLVLNQTKPVPLSVRGWSKAAAVSGGADSDYSLYADLTYSDGSTLWGQTASFRTGTHDWQERRLMIFPDKPVKSLTLHCLFRHHSGKVWFDDVAVRESASDIAAVMFQGVAVRPLESPPVRQGATRTLESGDGLRMSLRGGTVASLTIGNRVFQDGRASGFLVRDVAADSDFFPFDQGLCPDLGLKIEMETLTASNRVAFQGRVSDSTGRDRAISLVFAVPVRANGWTWGDDIRRTRPISGSGEFANQVSVHCGATGTQSLYPLASVWDEQSGLALGLDMARPAVYRVGYNAALERLFIAFDLGLAKETERFPGGADFRFVLFQFDHSGGFRAAWQKYMEIFPEYFAVRSKEQGLWMPFTDVSRVQGWQDFGFRYHEGNNNVSWDDEHGILSFRYTEPMTWWMPMAKDIPRTLPDALRVRDGLAEKGESSRRRMAELSRVAAMQDDAGDPALLFRNEPWANGAVWSLNPNPWLAVLTPTERTNSGAAAPDPAKAAPASSLNAATVYWNEPIKERLYGPGAKGHLDGEYLDSLEGYVTAELNFRRDHFRNTTVPLTFSLETKQLALFKGLAVFEFTRWLADDVHHMDKLMFANGVPYRFTYLCPWLDVLGTETDWLQAGKYHPSSLATMDLWRSTAGGKPYLLLMNTDYDTFTPDLVEKYFERALFYGMWPGFFSHNASENPYWQNPRWYERDRPLFRKFIPLIKSVAEAGWHPVPYAKSQNDHVLIERFGPTPDGIVYLTLFNDTSDAQTALVAIDADKISLPSGVHPQCLLGEQPEKTATGSRILLPSEKAAVWRLER